ncbi:MAG: PDDEXK nuclease domain-containing protein [bacterium]|nr:PDDEXK nuclease domain-containing protein [bacterium]
MKKQIVAKMDIFQEIKELILQTKNKVAIAINSELSLLYWQIGKKISNEILKDKRAEYGQKIIVELAKRLTQEYGKGWSEKQLRHCLRIAETFSDETILSAVRRKLSWTHIKILMYIDDSIKREFYTQIAINEKWSSRQLQERINSQLYERTVISKKPEKTIKQDLQLLKTNNQISQDLVFRDPYILDFLGLSDTYSEKDLESAILIELQKFIIEFGTDFAFLARQKRITIDNRDYYIDLLFYHRKLKCLVAIDLKLGEFEAGFKGQMELYLNYLEKYETVQGENSPIGLILCAGKNNEHIELLQLHKNNIRVAEYLTKLPPKEILQKKLHTSIELAKKKLLKND